MELYLVYLVNASLLIAHEIDSAYWKEWELFGLPGGPGGFTLIHLPLVALILWGLVEVHEGTPTGYFLSMALGVGGVAAFCIHTYLISRGHEEFTSLTSRLILFLTLLTSLLQLALTLPHI